MSFRAAFTSSTTEPRHTLQDQQTRFGEKSGHSRRPLGDIANRYFRLEPESRPPPDPRDSREPIEHMHLAPPPPKYKGVEFIPSTEPWFEDPIELEPMPDLPEIRWP
jgi:hypothetical protein